MSVKQEIIKEMTFEIPVNHIQESADWYCKYLGFELASPVTGVVDLKIPSGTKICLFRPNFEDVTSYWYMPKKEENYRVRICFLVSNVGQLLKDLKEAGLEVNELVGEEGIGYNFKLKDPNGNTLALWGGFT